MAKYEKKRVLTKLRDKWGKEDLNQDLEFSQIEDSFVRMMRKKDWILDDQTWNDLDMNRTYLRMNRTFTNCGQQSLYNMLRILEFDETELKRRDKLVSLFQMDKDTREKVQARLSYVGKESYDSAASLLYREVPELPKARAWVYPTMIGLIASLLSIPIMGARSIILIVIFFMMSMFVHNSFSKETDRAMSGIRQIARMIRASKDIAALKIPELDDYYNDFFEKEADKCAIIMKKSRALGGGGAFSDPLGLSVYLNLLFLSEERAYLRCSMYIDKYAPVLRTLYRRMGELDAFQSVASVRRAMRYCAKPHFLEEDGVIRAEKITHPAIREAVSNDILIEGRNVVITGSNMSGKSTFLRTLGINAVLAQTFYMTSAKKYEASLFNVVTSISPSDDLMEGKSYYMAEAMALKRMVEVVDDERCSLLLIDEIFRGTNPLERVAGASALLEYLSERNALVVVATHDADITENIKAQYDNYHFEENVTKDSLDFDYKIKPGALKKPNGIRILEYLGYPDEIVAGALERVKDAFPEDQA